MVTLHIGPSSRIVETHCDYSFTWWWTFVLLSKMWYSTESYCERLFTYGSSSLNQTLFQSSSIIWYSLQERLQNCICSTATSVLGIIGCFHVSHPNREILVFSCGFSFFQGIMIFNMFSCIRHWISSSASCWNFWPLYNRSFLTECWKSLRYFEYKSFKI